MKALLQKGTSSAISDFFPYPLGEFPQEFFFVIPSESGCKYARLNGETGRFEDGCTFCNLPITSSSKVEYELILAHLDQIVSEYNPNLVTRIVLSNNGSIFHPFETPPEFFEALLLWGLRTFPNLNEIAVEGRIAYLNRNLLEKISAILNKDSEKTGKTQIKLLLYFGFEVYDEFVRQTILRKGLPFEIVENAYQILQEVSQSGRYERVTYEMYPYILFAPLPNKNPEKVSAVLQETLRASFKEKEISKVLAWSKNNYWDSERSIQDVLDAQQYFRGLSNQYSIATTLYINPTFVSKGTVYQHWFDEGVFEAPSFELVKKLLRTIKSQHHSLPVRLGICMEDLDPSERGSEGSRGSGFFPGLSVEGGSAFAKVLQNSQNYQNMFLFNETQDILYLS